MAMATPVEASDSESRSSAGYCIGVIGCGPKGFYCLESLLRRLQARLAGHHGSGIRIVIYEPFDFPGAGTVYAPTQPHFLRMNFAVRHIDAWTAESRVRGGKPTLAEWLSDHHREWCDPDAYPPRAVVGEYLHQCFQEVVDGLKQCATLERIQCEVKRVTRRGSKWQVNTHSTVEQFDELLITVGHEGWRPAAVESLSDIPPSNLVKCAFPVSSQLSVNRVPPQSKVAVRGFALTWIDATLAVTEGRGGEFVFDDGGCRYRPSGLEPESIFPFSRSGRPMLPKSCRDKISTSAAVANLWQTGSHRIQALPAPLDFPNQVWPIIVATCGSVLQLVRSRRSSAAWSRRVDQWWHNWADKPMAPATALQHMRDGYAVAVGTQPPNEPWVLGEAWRRLYPVLVDRISHGGLALAGWPEFGRRAAELERLAFGPPAENVGRMLALVDAGIVDLRRLNQAVAGKGQWRGYDVLINALIPPPTAVRGDSVLGDLLERGMIRRAAGSGGIHVDEQARPLNVRGEPVDGLAIMGRATEGCILGNDTLSRLMHDHPERWATAVARSAAAALEPISR